MSLNHRLNICRAYFSRHREFECSLSDFLEKIVLPPCATLAKSHILKIEEDGAHKLIYLRAIQYPLYWPKNIPLYNLYMILCESLYEKNWHYYETSETPVNPGDTVLDCGAAEGLFSLKHMESARCIAIEPSPVFIESLGKTFFRKKNVQVVPCALSDREGNAYLSSGTLNASLNDISVLPLENSSLVKTTTIDKLVRALGLKKVHYIKGDLESFELAALQGGEQTIRDHKPRIALTAYHQGNDWREIRDYVLSLVPGFQWRVKGLSYLDKIPKPVMIHFWPG